MSTKPERSLDATYRRRLSEGVVAFQRCGEGHAIFPPRLACPHCGDTNVAWEDSAGAGSIYSLTTISPRADEPYSVVILDLDEGFRMMSRLDGADATSAAIGGRVRITVRSDRDGAEPLPMAELAASA